MPIYEYACNDCGNQFETLVRSGDTPACPSCHSNQLDKQLSVFATTGDSGRAAPALPVACGSCGHRDGPGACGFH